MKKRSLPSSALFFFSFLILFSACGRQQTGWRGTVDEVDGVTVVHNPIEPIYEDALALEVDLSLGKAEGAEEYLFSEVRSVAVDDSDNIYVLDSKEAHIRVFDPTGEYIKTIGKKGQGPDEFQGPRYLFITPQQELLVNDRRSRQLKFLGMDGAPLRQISTAKYFNFRSPLIDTSGRIISDVMRAEENMSFSQTLRIFTADLDDIQTLSKAEVASYPEVNPTVPRHFWAVNTKDQIIWGLPFKYEFHILAPDGTLVKTIRKEYHPIPITQADRDKWYSERFGGEENVPAEVKIVWTDFHNAFQHISIDEQDRVFVQTYEADEDSGQKYFDVFDPDGKCIARVPLKSQPQAWKNNKLYTIEEDEDGYQYVKRYQVTWKI